MKATSLYPTELTHIDKTYRLEVALDESEHTYDYVDHESETRASAGGDGLHVEKELFKGKTKKKEFSFEFGGVTASSKSGSDEGVSMDPVVYSFETSRIKEPLFTFLEQHGWERKKGFLRRLFS